MNCFETRKQKEDDKLASISAKLHWNAFVANKMRCTFCHCVSGGCRASTTGCTAVFLFQAHHALPRKPVLPHKWASGGSSLGGFWGRLRRFSHPSCSNLKIKSYIHYELWSIKCEKTINTLNTLYYLHLSICIVWLHHFQEVEGSLNCETSAITTKLPFSVSCRSALFFGFCSS